MFGAWSLVQSDNWDSHLRALGFGTLARIKVANMSMSYIVSADDDKINISVLSRLQNTDVSYTLNGPSVEMKNGDFVSRDSLSWNNDTSELVLIKRSSSHIIHVEHRLDTTRHTLTIRSRVEGHGDATLVQTYKRS